MELKGIITLGEKKLISCCSNIQDLNIGGLSLYNQLSNLFNLEASEYWENYDKESPKYAVRYVILDQKPKEDEEKSFEQQAGEVITEMIFGSLITGCYSEWTCGYGDFDYIMRGNSIFEELRDSVGKYIHFKI